MYRSLFVFFLGMLRKTITQSFLEPMATGRLHYCAKAKPAHCKNVGAFAKMNGNGTEMTEDSINNATYDKSVKRGCDNRCEQGQKRHWRY